MNRRDLVPIITEGIEGYPSLEITWECLIGCLSVGGSAGSVDFLCVCTPQLAPHRSVRCGIITYFAASGDIKIAPTSPLPSDV